MREPLPPRFPLPLIVTMAAVYGAAHVSLHVRISKRAALTLGFAVQGVEKKYCECRPCARLTDLFIYLWHRRRRRGRVCDEAGVNAAGTAIETWWYPVSLTTA